MAAVPCEDLEVILHPIEHRSLHETFKFFEVIALSRRLK